MNDASNVILGDQNLVVGDFGQRPGVRKRIFRFLQMSRFRPLGVFTESFGDALGFFDRFQGFRLVPTYFVQGPQRFLQLAPGGSPDQLGNDEKYDNYGDD